MATSAVLLNVARLTVMESKSVSLFIIGPVALASVCTARSVIVKVSILNDSISPSALCKSVRLSCPSPVMLKLPVTSIWLSIAIDALVNVLLKIIISSPALALASKTACLKLPWPESAVFNTV